MGTNNDQGAPRPTVEERLDRIEEMLAEIADDVSFLASLEDHHHPDHVIHLWLPVEVRKQLTRLMDDRGDVLLEDLASEAVALCLRSKGLGDGLYPTDPEEDDDDSEDDE